MPRLGTLDMPKDFESSEVEARCRDLWETHDIHRFDPEAEGEIFSVDTPPPYVSAAHLHVGHAMSYAQAEFIVRYQRMQGRRIFYPMGFDDNGLPTERFVEQKYETSKKKMTRSEFRALCVQETREGAKIYERLWRALGLSVDWTQRYSTIDDHCRRTSQLSFLDLYRRGRLYRSAEPVFWDTALDSALAQADLETLERKSKLHDVEFRSTGGDPLVISTTRPELIPACVALYRNPNDERYAHLEGQKAVVPLFEHEVPILADEDVKVDFGTGLMMVCTFGDAMDVARWKRDQLPLRMCIGRDGRMTEVAGAYEKLPIQEARSRIVKDLKEAGSHLGQQGTNQLVAVAERTGTPVEFQTVPQWFIRIMDLGDRLKQRSAELQWYPEMMKVRLDQWIDGLAYDWNISRQRFYGVPFPIWYCAGCGEVILAEESALPVDPVEDPCPASQCPQCGGGDFEPEADVMDTWMTSSLTPLINANWAKTPGRTQPDVYPMTLRVQAHEIIRTWLFYTVMKSDQHTDSLPWRDVMISGWGLNEQGKKISKRDLQAPKPGQFNRYDPYEVIAKYGADALRHWASRSHLGQDTRYSEKDVKAGRKLVVKLWNSARFCTQQLEDFDPDAPRPALADRTPEDRWILAELHRAAAAASRGFEKYDYAGPRAALDRFFWHSFCDNYLEIVKDRFWTPDRYPEEFRASTRATLWEALRGLLGLFAPFLPFVTEELYQRVFQPFEEAVSLHVTRWPESDPEVAGIQVPEMDLLLELLAAVRTVRTEVKVSQTRELAALVLDLDEADPELAASIVKLEPLVQAAARCQTVRYAAAAHETALDGVRIDIEQAEAS